jgi:signal transduction histidine kinase/ligand-binding sensor domain-containing protein
MRLRTFCAAAGAIAMFHSAALASDAWRVSTWTAGDALPQGAVYDMAQTRDGYLWFATLGGLVRYDGVEFTVFERSTTPGLRSNRFATLVEAPDGALWSGTEDGFVTSHRDGRFATFSLDGSLTPVLGLDVDASSKPWACSPAGLFQFDGTKFARIGPGSPTRRFPYLTGCAAVLDEGLLMMRPGRAAKLFALPGLADRTVTATVRGGGGATWIVHEERGFLELRGETLTRHDAPQLMDLVRNAPRGTPARDAIGAVTRTRDGAYWIARSDRGIARVDATSVEWITPEDGLAGLDVARIEEDRDGTIWVTTRGTGISAIRRKAARTYGAAAGLNPANVYPILPWNGQLLAGTWGGGLFRFDGTRFHQAVPSSGFVLSLADGGEGTLWMSTHRGGVKRIAGSGVVRDFSTEDGLPSMIVPAIYRARSGSMWFGTSDGLATLSADGRFTTFRMPTPASNAIQTIVEDRDGSLLLGTRGGVVRFRGGNATLLADERSGLSSESVRALHVDPDGTIWIGTYDGGLNRLREGRLSAITTRQGLFDNGVFAIVEEGGFFWMSSNRGVHRASRRELEAVAAGSRASLSPLALTQPDGLLSPECNGNVMPAAARTPDGRIWFPTQQGIVAVDPRLVPRMAAPPPILLAGIEIDGQAVRSDAEVRIGPEARRIEFRFAAPSTLQSAITRYRYKLEGFDRDWNEIVGSRVAAYTSLPPGTYRFLVTASRSAGTWNSSPASVSVRVLPPFWRTWWFVAGVAALAVFLLAALYRSRIRKVERERAAQAEFSRRLMVQQEEERKRVASELHDSIGQSLLIIKNRALLAIDGTASTGEQLQEISETASSAVEEVRRIAHNLRPVELDHLGLTRSLEVLLKRMEASSPILFSADLEPVDRLLPKEAEVNVFRIVQEWLSNVARHSNASAALVSLRREDHHLKLRIRDDGDGFPAARGTRPGIGLRSIAERVRMIGGTVDIRSEAGEGTTMTVEVPLHG